MTYDIQLLEIIQAYKNCIYMFSLINSLKTKYKNMTYEQSILHLRHMFA